MFLNLGCFIYQNVHGIELSVITVLCEIFYSIRHSRSIGNGEKSEQVFLSNT